MLWKILHLALLTVVYTESKLRRIICVSQLQPHLGLPIVRLYTHCPLTAFLATLQILLIIVILITWWLFSKVTYTRFCSKSAFLLHRIKNQNTETQIKKLIEETSGHLYCEVFRDGATSQKRHLYENYWTKAAVRLPKVAERLPLFFYWGLLFF